MDSYRVGGLVRVSRNNPDESGLQEGQVVTIAALGVDKHGKPYARVTPGDVKVYLADITPVEEHVDQKHPEDDPLDAQDQETFERLIDFDRDLRVLDQMTEAEARALLGIEPEKPKKGSEPEADGAIKIRVAFPNDAEGGDDEPEHPMEAPHNAVVVPSEEGDGVLLSDTDGDQMAISYMEAVCEDHGRQAAILFRCGSPNGFILEPESIPMMIAWLQEKHERITRKQAEDEQGKSEG